MGEHKGKEIDRHLVTWQHDDLNGNEKNTRIATLPQAAIDDAVPRHTIVHTIGGTEIVAQFPAAPGLDAVVVRIT